MSGKFEVTAELDTVVSVRYSGQELSHGKWKTDPGGIAAVGKSQLCIATNRSGASAGPAGWVGYLAADGTQFTFKFDDPSSQSNSCSSSMQDTAGPWYLPTPDYPTSGKVWTVTYKIAQSSAFFDAPVFPSDVLDASKCEAFDRERVEKWIGPRTCVRLADALGQVALPPVAKLWCATHELFLTPASKALLTRDLAQHAASSLSSPRGFRADLLDQALQANHDAVEGRVGAAQLGDLRRRLREQTHALAPVGPRDAELTDTICALTDPDPARGWSHAVSSFLGDAQGEPWTQRATTILDLVEARL